MKKFKILFFFCCFFLQTSCAPTASASLDDVSAKAVCLIEARTGRVVYEKNSQEKLYPASTTKIVTALVALEKGTLTDIVTVGSDAAGTEGSSMGLETGDQLTLRELLYGTLMVSGNDATIAIADHVGGGVEPFAKLMTAKAKEAGAEHTHFANSSGLPNPEHYTTAADLAKIAQKAYSVPSFREIVKTKNQLITLRGGRRLPLENTNLLLDTYQGCNGIKTGYTKAAGECLIASAERNGVHLIAVVMHADKDDRWEEAAKLFDYGFQSIRPQFIRDRHALVKTIHVRGGEDYQVTVRPKMNIFAPVFQNDGADFSLKTEIPRYAQAPIRAGQHFGYVNILYKGAIVDRVEMIADHEVKKGFSLLSVAASWWDNLCEWTWGA